VKQLQNIHVTNEENIAEKFLNYVTSNTNTGSGTLLANAKSGKNSYNYLSSIFFTHSSEDVSLSQEELELATNSLVEEAISPASAG
jgi:hypothetical protein